jgi:IS5 family transposase
MTPQKEEPFMRVEETYCIIDEILKVILPKSKVGRKSKLKQSAVIAIMVEGQRSGYTSDKQLYHLTKYGELRGYFSIPSYAQFNRSIRACRKYFDYVLEQLIKVHAGVRELYIIDSTALPINQFNGKPTKWGSGNAQIAKNMHGWYQGYKLHIITNDRLEIASVLVTPANFSDVKALENQRFIKSIHGTLIGDKGYIATEPVRLNLLASGIRLIAKQRDNMDPYLNKYYGKLLTKRRRIERVLAYLKRSLTAIRRFARTPESFIAHALAAVIAYIMRFTVEDRLTSILG